MRTTLLAMSLVLVPFTAGAQTPEDRLVEAELLEVSAGDLEKAMAAYKAIAEDEKAPGPVRARALLSLGRSQRKAGQLEAAKKTLGDLIAKHPDQAEVIRQAKGFLEELETGRARNPSFDWITDVEKSPEIQARVFDWCMALVGSDVQGAATAARQLLALGTIALPVVERVLDASRDDTQRYLLGMIAVRTGRLERLPEVLEREIPYANELRRFGFPEYLDTVREMPSGEKRRVLDAAARIPETAANAPRRAALLLAAGDAADLSRKLELVHGEDSLAHAVFRDVLERDPAMPELFGKRAKDLALSPGVRLRYFDALFRSVPAKLGLEHFAVLYELEGDARGRLDSIVAAGRFDVLERLADGPVAESVLKEFHSTYRERLHAAPGAWAPVLRRLRHLGREAWAQLHRFGEVNDEAAGEAAAFLASRRAEAPEYTGYGARKDSAWVPSARYAELMAGLLDSGDPVTLAIALEALALAPAGVGPEVLPALERLVLSPPEIHVREFAIYALLRRFGSRPETGPRVARILLEDFRLGRHVTPEGFLDTPIPPGRGGQPVSRAPNLGRVNHAHPTTVHTPEGPRVLTLDWVEASVGREVLEDFLPQVLGLGLSDGTREFLEWYRGGELMGKKDPAGAVIAVLSRLETPAHRAAALHLSGDVRKLARTPGGLDMARSVAMDGEAPPDARRLAFFGAGMVAADWLDWPRFLASDDPLLRGNPENLHDHLAVWLSKEPSTSQEEVLRILAKDPSLKRLRLRVYPRTREDRVQVLEAGLTDPETEELAVNLLLQSKDQGPELYRKLLETPSGRANETLQERIRQSRDESLIEPLVKLLDDRSPEVREFAFQSLNEIRAALAHKEEWRALVEAMKAKKKE